MISKHSILLREINSCSTDQVLCYITASSKIFSVYIYPKVDIVYYLQQTNHVSKPEMNSQVNIRCRVVAVSMDFLETGFFILQQFRSFAFS